VIEPGGAPVARVAARVVLVDRAGRTLLFRGGDPHRPQIGTWWFTPGGGVENGETLADAARREVTEETGLDVGDVGEPVLVRTVRFGFEGVVYDQVEHFFVVHVDVLDLGRIDESRWTDEERRVVVEYRWWTVEELRTTTEQWFPEELVELMTMQRDVDPSADRGNDGGSRG